jgi:hypothetical protein
MGLLLAMAAAASHAGGLRYCDASPDLDAAQRDTLLQVAAVVRQELQQGGTRAALVSRSGLDLRRLGVRYSHAGIGLADSPGVPWSVRQLYFDCDEGRARLFDQGLAGFVLGQHDARTGFVSLVLLPVQAAEPLARAALDDRLALALLGGRYSANAHAYSTRYQNCNQWVAELMAAAWGDGSPGHAGQTDVAQAAPSPTPRARAQHWLREAGYRPSRLKLPSAALLLAVPFMPWVHLDDHPEEALQQRVMEVSMPAALEAFVQAREPSAQRIELCYTPRHIVLRRGWTPLSPACEPEADDETIALR